MEKAVYVFQTLYSGCGDMSISVWDNPDKVYDLLKERIGTHINTYEEDEDGCTIHKKPDPDNPGEFIHGPFVSGKRKTDLPSKKAWKEACQEDGGWDWEFEYDWSCTRIRKRILNTED